MVVPVWFVVDTADGARLARETQETTGEAITAAVEAMIAGPVTAGWETSWSPRTVVLGVRQDGDVITVDLSADARTADVAAADANLMVQQLVYTVTDAAGNPDLAVSLIIEGEPAGELWGEVTWDEPVVRGEPESTRTSIQVDSPAAGEIVITIPVTVTGEAATTDPELRWRVLNREGSEVETGATPIDSGGQFAPFSFTVELPPGRYTLEVSQPSSPELATREFQVRLAA